MNSKPAKVRKGVLIVAALACIAGILALLPPIEIRAERPAVGVWYRSMDSSGGSMRILACGFYGFDLAGTPFVRCAFDGRQLVVRCWWRYSWFGRLVEGPPVTVLPVGPLKRGQYAVRVANGDDYYIRVSDPIVILPMQGAHDNEIRHHVASRYGSEWRVDVSKVYVGKYESRVFPHCPAYYAEYDVSSLGGFCTSNAREDCGIAVEIEHKLYYPTPDHPEDLTIALHACSHPARTRLDVVRLLRRLVREWSCELEWVAPPVEIMAMEPANVKVLLGQVGEQGSTVASVWVTPEGHIILQSPTGERKDLGPGPYSVPPPPSGESSSVNDTFYTGDLTLSVAHGFLYVLNRVADKRMTMTPIAGGYRIMVSISGQPDLSYLAGRLQTRVYLYKNGTFLRQ